MQAINRALPVIVTAIGLTVGSAAVAVATPATSGSMTGPDTHMGQLDGETLEAMHDLMEDGASVGAMHRWMVEQGVQLGQMHRDMADTGMPHGAMHRGMTGR